MLTLLAKNAIPRRAVIVAGGLLVLVVLTGTAIALWLFRSAALATAEWDLKNIAVVLAEQTRQGMLTVDMALRATAEDYRGRGAAARPLSEEALHARMHERVGDLPQLRSLLVIRPDGDLGAHSNVFPAPEMNFRDRDYFTVHRDGKGPPLFFGVPVKGRVMGAHLVHTLSRRMEDPQGEFLGVVIAGIDVRYLHDIYRSLELGPAGRVFLFRKDSVLLTSFPADDAEIGGSFPAHALFRSALPGAASGVLQARGLLSDHPRLIAYHSLQNYPLVIAVSSTTDYVLREWRKQSLYAAISALGAAGVIVLATFLFARQLRVSEELAGEVTESELRWRTALEAAGHGVWDLDVAAGRVFCSQRYREILGHAPREATLERAEWLAEIHAEDRSDFERKVDACLAGEHSTCSAEVRFDRGDGGSKWGLIRGTMVSADSQGRARRVAGTMTDVTEQRLAQQRLGESEARLNSIIGSAMDAIITVDGQQNVVLWNAAAEKIFHCPAREAVGRPLDRFIPGRFRTAHSEHVGRFGATGVTMRQMGARTALFGLRATGEEFPIDASISQVEVGGYRFYTVILRDITGRQKAAAALDKSHQELRELYTAMHEVREAERTRIARELHDELAQWLTALKMDVSWIAARLPKDLDPLVDRAAKIKGVVDTTVAAVRRIAADLRPVMLDDLGVVPAVESLLHGFSQRTGIVIGFNVDCDGMEFKEPLATAVYRMVQEALTNVARHAQASEVEAVIRLDGDRLVVRVCDNGRGIDAALPRKAKSYGLLGIRERAQTLGGTASIFSPAEGGTVVEIVIPVASYRSGEAEA